jgi:hypothetical protein
VDHDNPARCAFCMLFFVENGGQYTPEGMPIAGTLDDNGNPDVVAIRSLCPHPYDCGACPILQKWVLAKQAEGWVMSWECDVCLSEVDKKKYDRSRVLPGYYHSGRGGIPLGDPEYDPDKYKLHGCTRCGDYFSMLQLVMRRAQ